MNPSPKLSTQLQHLLTEAVSLERQISLRTNRPKELKAEFVETDDATQEQHRLPCGKPVALRESEPTTCTS
jgi:chaperonin cofactor prefoldin